MVFAIVSETFSSEYSWSENKLKSGDLNSSRVSVLKCLLDDRNSRSGSSKSVNSSLVELLVVHYLKQGINNQKLDTPYPMEMDTPYRVIDQSSAQIRRIFLDGYGVLVVRTNLDNTRLLQLTTQWPKIRAVHLGNTYVLLIEYRSPVNHLLLIAAVEKDHLNTLCQQQIHKTLMPIEKREDATLSIAQSFPLMKIIGPIRHLMKDASFCLIIVNNGVNRNVKRHYVMNRPDVPIGNNGGNQENISVGLPELVLRRIRAKPVLSSGKFSLLLDQSLGNKYVAHQTERMVLASTLCIRRATPAQPYMSYKAEIKLRAKTVPDLVSNVLSIDMFRLKLTKLLLKVTVQRSLGLEPDERLIDLGSRIFFLCPKKTVTAARSGNKDDEVSDQTTFKQLTLDQAIPLDRIDPSQVLEALNEFTQKLTSASTDLDKAEAEIRVDVHSALNYALISYNVTCLISTKRCVKRCVLDVGMGSFVVDAAMMPHIANGRDKNIPLVCFLIMICEHIKRQHDNYLMKGEQTCSTSLKSCVPDGGSRSLGVDAAMRPHIADGHMQREKLTGTIISHATETYVHVQSNIDNHKDYIMLI
ncbi:ATP synthase subunit delta', mitochondrial-like protein [Tanacetum coccineum]